MRLSNWNRFFKFQRRFKLLFLSALAIVLSSPRARALDVSVISAETRGNSNAVTVTFSRPVSETTATNLSNYTIVPTVSISSIALVEAAKVRIFTSGFLEGQAYMLTATGIQERLNPSASVGNTNANLVVITRPGDPIVSSSADTDSPPDQQVENAIDGQISTKYLNIKKLNTGFTVTPSIGSTVVSGLVLTSASDPVPFRDPTSYKLEGSNDKVIFRLISEGNVGPFGGVSVRQEILFPNTAAFSSYRLTFPTIVDAGNTEGMQIGEVELLGEVVAVRFLHLAAQGSITRKDFLSIGGALLSDLTNSNKFPDKPDLLTYSTSFEAPVNVRENYAMQFQGYVTAPASGDYVFYICSDDQGALYLSTDESPQNKRLIASEPQWNSSRAWINGPNQSSRGSPAANISGAVHLESGRRYYIEALMKENLGGDNLAVAWRKPGDPQLRNTSPPIPGMFLSSLSPTESAVIVQQPASAVVEEYATATFSVVLSGSPPYDFQWYRNGEMLIGENGPALTLNDVPATFSGSTFHCVCGNAFKSSRSAAATLNVTPGPSLRAVRSFQALAVFPPGTADIAVRISYHGSDPISGLEFQETLPSGWIFDSVVSGPSPSGVPESGETGNVLFRWNAKMDFPFTFVYRIRFAPNSDAEGRLNGEVRVRNGDSAQSFSIAGANEPAERRTLSKTFHRVLWGGTVLSTAEWDQIADAGFTLVQSYGGDPNYLRQMLDEAQRRGIKMIAAGNPSLSEVPWLKLETKQPKTGSSPAVFPHVIHHFSQPEPKLLLYGSGAPGLTEGIEISLSAAEHDTLGKLAAYLNSLGLGITASVLPGKQDKASLQLATRWYGNVTEGSVTLYGSEINESQYHRYVDTVKEHPALFCFAPFDDPDIRYFSPTYERYIRGKLREWAPKVPAYLLVSNLGMSAGTFEHDHKIAAEAYDGVIVYIYPNDWENAGAYRDVDSIRTLLQDWWSFHSQTGPKDLILMVSAFSFTGPTPPGGPQREWDAAMRSGVPLTGFGFYTWSGGYSQEIRNDPILQADVTAVNRQISTNHLQVTIQQNQYRVASVSANVEFRAAIRGGKQPLVCTWDFGDGTWGWGENVSHQFGHPGNYEVVLRVLAADRLTATKTSNVFVLGDGSPVVQRDFNDGSTEGFVPQIGNWAVVNDAYQRVDNGTGDGFTRLTTSAAQQYTIEADVKLMGEQNNFWLIYAGANTNSQYRLEVQPLQSATFVKEGLTTRLRLTTDTGSYDAYLPWTRERFYHVTLDVLAGAVLASVNDSLLVKGSLRNLAGDGMIGFGGTGAAAQIDNLRVTARGPLQVQPTASQSDTQSQSKSFLFSADRIGGTEPVNYLWDFGDGLTSTVAAPQHSYTATGAYQVKLRATDSKGASVEKIYELLAGSQIYYREAEDYDWTDGTSPGHPTDAASGQHYGQNRDGRRDVDFRQAVRGQGDLKAWRDGGEISMETGSSDTGINISSTSPGDWWNYTFQFPATGLVRLRALLASARPVKFRVFWREQYLCDLQTVGGGWQSFEWAESPVVPVDGKLGWFRFEVVDGSPGASLNFARFQVAFFPALDSDGDGIADFADLDSDNDGFMDADERTTNQSNALNAASRPADADGDHLSDTNDPDDDNDGMLDISDPAPLVANRPPIIGDLPDQTIHANESFALNLSATDIDLPPQNLVFRLVGDVPAGVNVTPQGRLTWTPTAAQANRFYSLSVTVTDSGLPTLSATNKLTIHMTEALPEGFEAMQITTSKGPVTIVLPRKRYQFEASHITYYVSKSGDDGNQGTIERPWKTFARALRQLVPGDVLYVRGGDYFEPFEVTKSGTRLKPIVISAFPGERVRILQPDGWQYSHPGASTIYLNWVDYMWLHGFEVEGARHPDEKYSSINGHCILLFNGGEGCRILNNTCSRTFQTGIYAGGYSPRADYLIEGNVVFECGEPWLSVGIGLNASGDKGIIARGNAVLNCGGGINVWGYAPVPDNHFVSRINLYNNLVAGNSTIGSDVLSAATNIFAHNIWAANPVEGLGIHKDVTSNVIMNDVFYMNSPVHVRVEPSAPFPVADLDLTSNVLDYCAFDPQAELAAPLESFAPWLGGHLVIADPLFVDALHYDFRLQSTSPARNAAGPVKLLGALPSPDIGLFSATNYWQPDLVPVPDMTVDEEKDVQVQFRLAIANPNVSKVKFEFIDVPPDGARLDETTGIFTWKPTEAQGPGTYTIRVLTTANDSSLLTAMTSFQINVREVNTPPVFNSSIPDQTVVEGAPWTLAIDVGLAIADTDRPAQQLTYSLAPDTPSGIQIDSTTGRVTWTPTEAQGPSTNVVTIVATDDGSPHLSAQITFRIVVLETNTAPVLLSIPDQIVDEGAAWSVTVSANDADLPPNKLTYSLVQAPGGVTIDADTGRIEWLPSETDGPGQYAFSVEVIDNGVPPLSARQAFQVTVNEINSPPTLTPIADQIVKAATPLSFTASASDLDIPANVLTFSLDPGAPTGATVNAVTGMFSWTPPPAIDASTNVITVRVADNGAPPFSASQSFTVVVSPSNIAPVMSAIPDQTIPEEIAFTFTITAADADTPAQKLTYSLDGAPSGAAINPITGEFAWTPTEAQGPGTYRITVRVSDDGSPPLTDEKSFALTVNEMNQAPVLAPIPDQRLDEATILALTIVATDPDLPSNKLNFELLSGPAGMTLDPITGMLKWTPEMNQVPSTNQVVIKVADDGNPPLNDSKGFAVIVQRKSAAAPVRVTSSRLSPDSRFSFEFIGEPGRAYNIEASSDLENWMTMATLSANAQGHVEYSENLSPKLLNHYFRVVGP